MRSGKGKDKRRPYPFYPHMLKTSLFVASLGTLIIMGEHGPNHACKVSGSERQENKQTTQLSVSSNHHHWLCGCLFYSRGTAS